MAAKLTLFKDAAAKFEVSYAVISSLVKRLSIEVHPVPHNGNAKGIDSKGMRRLARVLSSRKEPQATDAASASA